MWLAIALALTCQDDARRYVDGLRAIDAGRPEIALDHARTVLMKDASRAEFYELAGRAHLAAGRMDDALRAAARALELDPRNLGALWVRAHARDDAAAIEDLTRILTITADRAPALQARARAWARLGLLDLAAADGQEAQDEETKKRRAVIQQEIDRLTKCIEREPANPKHYLERSEKHLILGATPDAIADASRAIELDPRSVDAWVARARACAWGRSWDRAIEDISRAIELEPDRVALLLQRSGYRSAAGRHKEAVADCDRALKLQPELVDAHMRRGEAHIAMSDYEKAEADFTRAIELAPKVARAYVQRGWARTLGNRSDAAVEDFTVAIELAPGDSDAYLRRSGAWAKLEQWAKAIRDIDRAIELVPALAKSDPIRKRRAEYVKKAEE